VFDNGTPAGSLSPSGGLSHDKVFKKLFEAFLRDLIEMVNPRIAAALDLSRIIFKSEPLFSHLGKREHRLPDLVASIPLVGSGGRSVLVHLEIEVKYRATMKRRMWRYFSLLSSHNDVEVFSMVVFLSGGPTGVELCHHSLKVGEVEVNRFSYWAFGLSSCDAEEWLERPQLLVTALAALMKVRGDRVEHKLRLLRAAAQERNPEKLYLLNIVISLYFKLQDGDQARFEAALAKEKAMLPELPDIPLSLAEYNEYKQRLEMRLAEGKNLGLAEGKNLGLAEGKNLGLAEGKKSGVAESIVRLVTRRFGGIPESLKARLEAIADPKRLQEIFDAAIDASSVSQLEEAIAGG